MPDDFERALAATSDVEGWISDDQARRLWESARAVPPRGRIVEIGSFRGRSTILLATAALPGVEVVAIDPHAGNDRGPQEIHGFEEEASEDFEVFHRNLVVAGVADRVRHIRRFSADALGEVDGAIDVLFIDGAHRFGPARADVVDWGARVRIGGTLLVHDSFSSVGVTLALLSTLAIGGEFEYLGRDGSLARYRRRRLTGGARLTSGLRQVRELGWFARNLAVKVAIVTKREGWARRLGHDGRTWPY